MENLKSRTEKILTRRPRVTILVVAVLVMAIDYYCYIASAAERIPGPLKAALGEAFLAVVVIWMLGCCALYQALADRRKDLFPEQQEQK